MGIFHYKPSILRYPHFQEIPLSLGSVTWLIHKFHHISAVLFLVFLHVFWSHSHVPQRSNLCHVPSSQSLSFHLVILLMKFPIAVEYKPSHSMKAEKYYPPILTYAKFYRRRWISHMVFPENPWFYRIITLKSSCRKLCWWMSIPD